MNYDKCSNFCHLLVSEVGVAKGIRIKLLIFLYRVSSFGAFRGGVFYILTLPVFVLYRGYSEFLLGIELPVNVNAGPGLSISHGYGLVVHRDTIIGARCRLRQGVTIGNKIAKDGRVTGAPVIGDDVEFGAGSVVIGDIKIGSRVTIGACTVVTKDIPDDHIVVGQSVRLILREGVK